MPGLGFDWLAEDDRLHIVEAADRFARMAEELEAVRERAALLHEQITDLRAEQVDQRALYISIVAFIFLPLTFITGLLGMNVEGIPYAHSPLSFWGIAALLRRDRARRLRLVLLAALDQPVMHFPSRRPDDGQASSSMSQ